MRYPRLLTLALVAGSALTLPARAQSRGTASAGSAIRISYDFYTLPNGLNVVLAPDHSTPTAAVMVQYHVGSKNEARGRKGFAHIFEHVMFTGSAHVPYGLHDRLTQGVGGTQPNGTTRHDETVYYVAVPSNYVESVLWLESDRMGFLLEKLDSAKFAAQRDIVQNERRQRYDNAPYGRAAEIVAAAMYPASHPYSWIPIGYMEDLQQATLTDVKSFFRLYYAPSNATLAIVGDFDPAQARRWIAKYFADLPRGKAITRPRVRPATLAKVKHLVFEDRVQVPRLYMVWPTAGSKANDTYALNVLGSILAPSRTARLTKALVYDRQSAASVFAGQQDHEDAGEFAIYVVPRAGHTLTELELATDSVLERFKREGPTADEMQRALAVTEFAFVSSLESNLGKAQLLTSATTYFGDPGYYRAIYAKTKGVTAADVKRVANKYLGKGRVVLSVVPPGKTDLAARSDASIKVTASTTGGRYIMQPD